MCFCRDLRCLPYINRHQYSIKGKLTTKRQSKETSQQRILKKESHLCRSSTYGYHILCIVAVSLTRNQDFALTWTLSPFSAHGSLPSAISFPFGNESVYFAETTQSQLLPKGSGFGTFDTSTTAPSIELDSNAALSDNSGNSVDPGSLLRCVQYRAWARIGLILPSRYPRWGIRIHCEKIPDGNINMCVDILAQSMVSGC